MGDLDLKSFAKACKGKMSEEDAEGTTSILCSTWEEEIKNPEWHPFRVVMVNGKKRVGFLFHFLHTLLFLIACNFQSYMSLWTSFLETK